MTESELYETISQALEEHGIPRNSWGMGIHAIACAMANQESVISSGGHRVATTLAAQHHNFFGYKWMGRGPSVRFTKFNEFEDKAPKYRSYESPEAGLKSWLYAIFGSSHRRDANELFCGAIGKTWAKGNPKHVEEVKALHRKHWARLKNPTKKPKDSNIA